MRTMPEAYEFVDDFLDCPRALPVQHIWHRSVVSNPLHPLPYPAGERPGQHHRLLPLVCSCLHHLLLLPFTALCLQSVACWLAGPGKRGCTFNRHADLHRGDKHTAETEARVSARSTAIVGLSASLGPLLGTLGQSG